MNQALYAHMNNKRKMKKKKVPVIFGISSYIKDKYIQTTGHGLFLATPASVFSKQG
jgi:hypothetical protein